ncbi:hypothetical protein [Streptomyces ossamyceticus]|uniref:Uncharacterized protein n=1 Tax=Streptomyces ossamyceticus TaxID=249581 RepID=A0ABV2VC74_9ACTN
MAVAAAAVHDAPAQLDLRPGDLVAFATTMEAVIAGNTGHPHVRRRTPLPHDPS